MSEQNFSNEELTVKIIVFSFIVLMFLFVFYHIKNPIVEANHSNKSEITKNNF